MSANEDRPASIGPVNNANINSVNYSMRADALSVPVLPPDADILTAALAYADAGWYVLPIDRATKHAGSVLGKGWPAKSSRDPKLIVAWFAGASHGLALHCGRSGAVVFDVDRPDAMPDELRAEIKRAEPPMQRTRESDSERAHYVFAQPAGRSIGNGNPKGWPKEWGEVRGRNGIIVVEPTPHEKAAEGGLYQWGRLGVVPTLGEAVAAQMPDQHSPDDAVTRAEVEEFYAKHATALRPELAAPVVNRLRTDIAASASRHNSTVTAACWAAREAQAGLYSARSIFGELWPAFRDALLNEPGRNSKGEWEGIVSWAIGQAALDDPNATRERATGSDPLATVGSSDVGQAGTPAERLRAEFLTADQVASRPNPVPLINGLLDLSSLAWLIGKSGSYKSFVALDMAGHVAAGRDWMGRRVHQGTVVYIVAEGVEGTTLRVRAWKERKGELHGVYFLPRPVQAAGPEWQTLIEACVLMSPCMIVIDTQARVTVGMEENSNTEMGVFIEQVEAMKRATGACILVVHHIGRNGEDARGASAIDGAQGTELRMKRTADLHATLVMDKQKDMADTETIDMDMSIIDLGVDENTGRKLSSLIITRALDGPVRTRDWVDNLTENQAEIVGIIADHFPDNGETKTRINAVLQERRKHAGRPLMAKGSISRSWDSLISRQIVCRVEKSERYALVSMPGGGESHR